MARPRRVLRHRVGGALRVVMAVAIIAAASWYMLPSVFDHLSDADEPSRPMVTTDDVNLRSGPGTSYDVIAVIPIGTEVAVRAESDHGFVRVETREHHGWMSSAYLSSAGNVLAQSETGQVAEIPSGERSDHSAAPTVPTAAPTYQPVIAQSTQVESEPQPGEKWIQVDRTNRTVTLHNGEIVVAQFDALIGQDLSADGYYSTAIGTYHVHVKEKSLVETPFAEGVYLTDFVGFDPDRSNGFHSPVRDANGNVVISGGTSTLGCVRLSEADAVFLFNFASIGMRVEVHD